MKNIILTNLTKDLTIGIFLLTVILFSSGCTITNINGTQYRLTITEANEELPTGETEPPRGPVATITTKQSFYQGIIYECWYQQVQTYIQANGQRVDGPASMLMFQSCVIKMQKHHQQGAYEIFQKFYNQMFDVEEPQLKRREF